LRAALFRKKQEILYHHPGPRYDSFDDWAWCVLLLWVPVSQINRKQTGLHAVTLVVLMCKMVAEVAGVCSCNSGYHVFVFARSEDVGVEIGGVHMV
jgi:hypothetical protein